jgi:pimeloyl-[acyl-carrier protein] synthase
MSTVDRLTPFLDLAPADIRANPHSVYHALRQISPVQQIAAGTWVVTGYAECRAILRDPRFSVDQRSATDYEEAREASTKTKYVQNLTEQLMLFRDPPDHSRLRDVVQRAFAPGAIGSLRARTIEISEQLIDEHIEAGHMELIADYARPLPVTVIAEMMGVPASERARFRSWARDLAMTLEPFVSSAVAERADTSARTLAGFLQELVADRRAHSRQDLLTTLVEAEQEDGPLADHELIANLMLLLIAGYETTMNLIGNGMHALLRHPEQLKYLRAENSLTPIVVEELIRFDGPVHMTVRIPIDGVTVGDRTIGRGDRVFVIIAAGNRDPAWFIDPDTLDIYRENNRHLGFGGGPHYCLGSALARLEAEIAFSCLIERLPNLALEGPEPEYRDLRTLRGLKSLSLSFDARQPRIRAR